MNSSFPLARKDDLIVQEMDGELVVYQGKTAQANVLNHTAAVIWKLCDGNTSVSEIAQRASVELNVPIAPELVWYTLDQLSKKNLLETRATMPLKLQGMKRRDFIRAGAIGAAVVLPVVVAMSAPKSADAASCIPATTCTTDADCCAPGSSMFCCVAFGTCLPVPSPCII